MVQYDIPKTFFPCVYETFEYLVTPVGLINAPTTFQRVMNHVFFDLVDDCMIVYLDNISIFSKTKIEYLVAFDKVFSRLDQCKLAFKESKCALFLKSVAFQGYVVSAQRITVQAGKIQAIKEQSYPRNITKLQQFIGLYNYYRHFIQQYAIVAAPLTDILWQKGSFTFGIEQEIAFQKLRDALIQAPVLAIFDPDLSKMVLADASGFISRAILEQLVDGHWHTVEYFSKRLSYIESHWLVNEWKILVCILA